MQWDLVFKLSCCNKIWQPFLQHYYREACQIAERSVHTKIMSRGFETSRDLEVRCRMAQWMEAVQQFAPYSTSKHLSLKFVPKAPINKIPALVQIMAWRRSSDKPLSEPMMVSLLTHICVARPQWVKCYRNNTVRSCALRFLWNPHKRHSIPCPWGRGVG